MPRKTKSIEAAMPSENAREVRQACTEFLAAADFYGVQNPSVKVLAARPLLVREDGWGTELFGDYHPETLLIRVLDVDRRLQARHLVRDVPKHLVP